MFYQFYVNTDVFLVEGRSCWYPLCETKLGNKQNMRRGQQQLYWHQQVSVILTATHSSLQALAARTLENASTYALENDSTLILKNNSTRMLKSDSTYRLENLTCCLK